MNIKQFHRRIAAMVLMLAAVVCLLGSTLYDVQVNSGEEYYLRSQARVEEKQAVDAGRGQILDRNGRVLVSDRTVYQVTLKTDLMGTKEEKARNILALVRAAAELGVEWTDTQLPVTREQPFQYTEENPFYTVEADEAGNEIRSLTRLGRLGVKLNWIRDPAAPPEEEQAPEEEEEPDLWERLKTFLTGEEPEPEPPAQPEPEEPYVLPDAEELLGILCSYFQLHGDGAVDEKLAAENGTEVPVLNIGDLDPVEARLAAGVLYELELRDQDIYYVNYVFARDVSVDFITRVKELKLRGVEVEAGTVRQYHTDSAPHILGRTGYMTSQEEIDYYTSLDANGDGEPDYQQDDVVGRDGAELAFESWLRGTPGERILERNTAGKIIDSQWTRDPSPGNNVVLTLDLNLQQAVENILAEGIPALASEETQGGACVVLDVKTAEVLAAASWPTYRLSTYQEDFAANSADPLRPFNNRAFSGAYPPGSTFKMITAIAGLQEGVIDTQTRIRDLGVYTYYPGYSPKCWIYRQNGRTHGLMNVTSAIENSCNYFFYDVGRQVGIERLGDYAARFGIGQPTGLELQENTGVMAGPAYSESVGSQWYEGSTLSVAIGQESTQVTPLQLANYVSTLVNGGQRHAVHLLKEVRSADFSKVVYRTEPQVVATVDISPENLEAVKEGMLAVASRGAGARWFNEFDYQWGAKTGSAQVSLETESNSVFVCFAPYDDPEIAVAVVVEHGGSGSGLAGMAAQVMHAWDAGTTASEVPGQENTLVP